MSVKYYDREAEKFILQTVNVDMRTLYDRFLPRISPGASILDAGCGSGRDARSFLSLGYRVTAFDASQRMAEHASAIAGIKVLCMSFEEVRWQNTFEGIWCCASLLHVRNSKFKAVGERLLEALKPGGSWYLSFKLGQGEHIRDGRLFVDHSESSLHRILHALPQIADIETWVSEDMRPGRDERWVNAIATRQI
jgi:SAM-dependent methyltransferase